jgi:DNA-binding NtrC family response regulator
MQDPPKNSRAIRVLIADDHARDLRDLRALISSWNYTVETATDGEDAHRKVLADAPDILITELLLPGIDGFELLRRVRQIGPPPVPIVLTAIAENRASANVANELGALAYFSKPAIPDELRVQLERAAGEVRESGDASARAISEMAGAGDAMQAIFTLLRQVAPSRASVFITGESGTGKELIARAIHLLSPRRERPFIAVNCAAFPEGLVESELFGHERGAFTGAVERRAGCLELATGGTLLLDEVGELPVQTQAKLLRVLDNSRVRRIGGRGEIQLDVRVLAATNRNAEEAVRSGHFRQDLFYRLNVFHISLPPLRERKDDLPALCSLLLEGLNRKHGRSVAAIDAGVLECLRQHSWPGNVRELRNVLETAVIFAGSGTLSVGHLPERFAPGSNSADSSDAPAAARRGMLSLPMGTTMERAQQALIEFTLQQTNNNKSRAARILGISSKTLHCKLRQYRAHTQMAAVG